MAADLDAAALARDRVRESIDTYERLGSSGTLDLVVAAAGAVTEAYRSGRKLVLFGNGGSAADAQHIAAEFVGRFLIDRAPLPALALSTNSSTVTAISNDYGYDEVFARQLRAVAVEGDVAIGFSTSGNSANVIAAMEAAREIGVTTIGFTGGDGGTLAGMVDHPIVMPADATPRVQEGHLVCAHILCEIVETTLFG
jgi:D-sedoheptulose 7-phosphate isomerase